MQTHTSSPRTKHTSSRPGYHIHTEGAVKAAAIKDGAAIKVVRGGDLTAEVGKGGAVGVKGAQNSAKVVKADIAGGETVIHAVDTVLLPVRAWWRCWDGGGAGGKSS